MRLSHSVVFLGLALSALFLAGCDSLGSGGDIDALETRNAQLQGTIAVMGTPAQTIAALEQAATQAVVLEARVAQAEADALAARATLTVMELSGGSSVAAVRPTSPAAVPPSGESPPPSMVTPTPTPSTSETQFTDTVVATGRDQYDCATGANTVFDASESMLYVVTRINYLPAGSQLSARWSTNGSLYFDDVQCWIPDQTYTDICAYCTVSPEGNAFETGIWSAEMLLDGQVMSQTQFQIVDGSQPQSGAEDTSAGQ